MEFIYRALQEIGFDHPIHPPLAHMPMGLIIGALIFFAAARLLKHQIFMNTAYHCLVLSLIFILPTAFLGLTDWWHFYLGVWSFPIAIKMILTGFLFITVSSGVIMQSKEIGGSKSVFAIYLFSTLVVVGLGYYGGQLVFSENKSVASGNLQIGEKLFVANCSGCHPGGGNIIDHTYPIIGSSKLLNLESFTDFNRTPLMPDGTKGAMPAFDPDKLSNGDLMLIYQYVTLVLSGRS